MVIKVQSTKIRPGYKLTEVGAIPEDWKAAPLTGLVVIQHGYGFQSQYFKPFGKYRLTTPGHFYETGGFRDVGEKQKFYEGPLPEGYLLSEGDLIVAMTEQTDGLLGSAAIVPIGNTYLHNQRLGKVKILSPSLSTRFLYQVFNSNSYRAKVRETAAGTKVKHTSPSKLLDIPIPLPPTKAEQKAIATVFSDTDALIECLEKLIAKKRDIKQATMQQLLTGKRRLPEFSAGRKQAYKQTELGMIPEDWNISLVEEIADVTTGDKDTQDKIESGAYPFFVRSQVVERINSYSYDGEAVLTAGDGVGVGKVFHYINGKFDFHQRVYMIYNFRNFDGFFFYLYFSNNFFKEAKKYNAKNSVDSIRRDMVTRMRIPHPSLPEQRAIATVLSDMDAEITALEQKRDKVRALKQGMMQELLTGKTRLL